MSNDKLPDEIFQHWVESKEEKDDKEQIFVYRPKGYNFPPSRGRRSFEIKENGEFILHEINSSDRPVVLVGRFEAKGNNIKVFFNQKGKETLDMEVISAERSMLKIRLS